MTCRNNAQQTTVITYWTCSRADKRVIFAAASQAQRAADFINGLQPASAG
jgi:antirestriction protein ArdC